MQDKDYITRFQMGDFDSFGELYEMYIDQIFAFVLRKTSQRELAEDITSQVWMKAMKGLEKFSEQEGASFKSWIYCIANNTIIDHYRSKKEQVDIDEIGEIGFSEDLAKCIDDKDKLQEVQGFLGGLKAIEQEIVVLRVWDELSYREIAQITGKKEDNCKQIYKRTLEKIQANLMLILLVIILL